METAEDRKKVLVVEDDVFLTNIYRAKLNGVGFIVEAAVDGHDAISKLELFEPDFILLDIVMPKMNGFEVLRNIKAEPKWKNIPIMVVSNLSDNSDIQKARELGAVDYVVKINTPIEHIVEKVQYFLSPKDKKPDSSK